MGKIADYEFLVSKLKNRKFVKRGALLVEIRDQEEMKKYYCPICAKPKIDPQIYFGEEICGQCKHDLDPDGIYDKKLSGKKGFKVQL